MQRNLRTQAVPRLTQEADNDDAADDSSHDEPCVA